MPSPKPAPEVRWLASRTILDQLAADRRHDRREWLFDLCLQACAFAAMLGLLAAILTGRL